MESRITLPSLAGVALLACALALAPLAGGDPRAHAQPVALAPRQLLATPTSPLAGPLLPAPNPVRTSRLLAAAGPAPAIRVLELRDFAVTGGAPVITSTAAWITPSRSTPQTVSWRMLAWIKPGEASSTLSAAVKFGEQGASYDTVPLLSGATVTAAQGMQWVSFSGSPGGGTQSLAGESPGTTQQAMTWSPSFGTTTRIGLLLVDEIVDGGL